MKDTSKLLYPCQTIPGVGSIVGDGVSSIALIGHTPSIRLDSASTNMSRLSWKLAWSVSMSNDSLIAIITHQYTHQDTKMHSNWQ